jgi:hypothetical protein
MNDPIVEEIRKHRDNHAKKFNYNLDAICADLMERQKSSGHRLVRLKPRRLNAEESTAKSAL